MLKGNIQDVSVASVVQLCCQEKKSGCLSFYKDAIKIGDIYFQDGEIIAAQMDNLSGEKAFYKLIRLKSGEFIFQNNVPLPQRQINNSFEYLLLEAARYEDEMKGYLDSIVKKLTKIVGKVKEIEEASPFIKEIFLFLSQCGYLLEAGPIEWIWLKEEENISLFLEIKGEIFKFALPSQTILEEVFSQISIKGK
ncbi:MAG: DUF4388 domain-containing protein [Candidatus Desulfofervidus auxilii]|nr:DUF4388 domain-containing protein [Candidatus Desulfofervidus auxilii]